MIVPGTGGGQLVLVWCSAARGRRSRSFLIRAGHAFVQWDCGAGQRQQRPAPVFF
jgi:hypothetical protein